MKDKMIEQLNRKARELMRRYSQTKEDEIWTMCERWNAEHENEEIVMCELWEDDDITGFAIEDTIWNYPS